MVGVTQHVGWRSLDTAGYHTQAGRALNMSRAASALADSTHAKGSTLPAAVSAAEHFVPKNDLSGFSSVFP